MNTDSVRCNEKILALQREAERLEEDALYSSKGHFNAEDTWVRRSYWLGVPRQAFVAARKGIEEGEATHKVDKED